MMAPFHGFHTVSAQASRSPVQGLKYGVIALNLFVYALAGLMLTLSRGRHERQVFLTTRTLARTMADNVSGLLDKLDVGLDSAVREVERQMAAGGLDGPRLTVFLDKARTAIRDFEGMWVVDTRGRLVGGPGLDPANPVSVADREYFRRLSQGPDPGLVTSKPVIGRISGAWAVMVCRRFNAPDGSFGGIVMGSLRMVDHFSAMFARVHVGPDGLIVLRDGDLTLVSRYPPSSDPGAQPNTNTTQPAVRAQVKASPEAGSFATHHAVDHLRRNFSYHRVPGYDYYVFVSRSPGDYLKAWWSEAILVGVLLTVFTAASALYARGEIRRARAALDERERHFQAALEFQPVPIGISEGDRIVWVNRAFRETFGYAREDIPTLETWNRLAYPEPGYRAQATALWLASMAQARAEDRASDPHEFKVACKDGSSRRVLIRGRQVGERFLVTFMDVTALRRADEERRALEDQVGHLQRLESVGRLAGGISHDMNNILGAILAVAEVLQIKEGEHRKLADLVVEAAQRGRALLRNLMAFARKDLPDAEDLDLNALVRAQAELLSSTTLQRVDLVLDLEPGLPRIVGSPATMATALMNLCMNAVDAMPGGGTLTLRTRSLDGGRVELAVRDTGQGMPSDVLARALEPFFTTKPVGKGTGLGLSMVYGTVKAHRGTLDLRSEEGRGTEVLIALPIGSGPGAPTVREGAGPAETRPLRVLLVDDDPIMREGSALVLRSLGHAVGEAEGGLEALRLFGDGMGWDLAVLDLNMPGMDGFTALERLRAVRSGLPVLVVSGYVDDPGRARLASLDRVEILAKPFERQQLQEAMARLAL